MHNIDNLKIQNIKFEIINEEYALKILKFEYSSEQLIEYSILFDRYFKGDNKGKFINLDFAHLYQIACLDETLQLAVMFMCISIEQAIKVKLNYDIESNGFESNKVVKSFIESEKDFLLKNYTIENNTTIEADNIDIFLKQIDLNQFFSVIHFGTLERFYRFFYSSYGLDGSITPEELNCIKRLRNITAHKIGILNKLNIKRINHNSKTNAVLGLNGIGQKILATNMKKQICYDLAVLIRICIEFLPSAKQNKCRELLNEFLTEYNNYEILQNNQTLASFCKFVDKLNQMFK